MSHPLHGLVLSALFLALAGCAAPPHWTCACRKEPDCSRNSSSQTNDKDTSKPCSTEKNGEKEENDGSKDKDGNGADKNDKDKEDKSASEDKAPKTIFEWAIGKKDRKDQKNGNGEAEEEDRIQTDRPDFTEASTTVGRGRIQLEAGYTFIRDRDQGTLVHRHSYPEALLRIGMFAEWFELRLGQNFLSERETADGVPVSDTGPTDLYLGVKLALTEQSGWLPESALVLQMTVPSGAKAFTANQVQPGVNLLYGWDIIPDCLTLGGSTQINRSSDTLEPGVPVVDVPVFVQPGHSFIVLAQSVTVGYTLTRRLGAYTEWFALFPHSSIDPAIGPEYFVDGGFTYLVTNNFQLDLRAGLGLNRHADDFFVGSGFAVRY